MSEIETTVNSTSRSINFLGYIRQLLDKDQKICVILVVGKHISRLPKLFSFLREAPNIEISLLDKSNTEKLITQPVEGVLQYNKEAIEKIYGLTSGHPYLTQAICSAIYGLVRDNKLSVNITVQNVEDAVEKAFELAQSGLDGFWSNLIYEQQIILAAAAEAESIAISQNQAVSTKPLPLKLLEEKYGITITEPLNEAYEQLVEYGFGFLEKTQGKIKIELIRRWLVKRHPLEQEINNVEIINAVNANIQNYISKNFKQVNTNNMNPLNELVNHIGLAPGSDIGEVKSFIASLQNKLKARNDEYEALSQKLKVANESQADLQKRMQEMQNEIGRAHV